ncbi:unnamed protein product [Clonostachys rosea]|uniref:Uncharacterized protein n=1 Tax=Bionectria ochroleuca TaxID=29856 RepID=A0ABY6U4E3_BIOOC|nr:unnamed protein product [Clonostachys rosea]
MAGLASIPLRASARSATKTSARGTSNLELFKKIYALILHGLSGKILHVKTLSGKIRHDPSEKNPHDLSGKIRRDPSEKALPDLSGEILHVNILLFGDIFRDIRSLGDTSQEQEAHKLHLRGPPCRQSHCSQDSV